MHWKQLPKTLWPPYDSWPAWDPPRNITSLDIPWVPSPVSFPLDVSASVKQRRTTIARIFRSLRWPFKSRSAGEAKVMQPELTYHDRFPTMLQLPLQPPSTKQLPLSEWRAFGAYSRPTVNGVDVHNTFTPSPTPYRELDPDEVDVEEVFRSLRSPSGATHPERWVRGIKHPALPQNPNWHVPGPNEPLPFPWECQLNPFLQASVTGPAPVYWNILKSRGMVLFGGPLDVSIPLAPQDLAQPATFPLVTHMYISGLGLAAARFPWKFCVVNAAGVRVRDVFDAILINFFELVFPAEVAQWAPERLARAKLEFQLRGGDVATDGLRRMDCLGGQLYFRGLAPNPDRTGWLLFVGPEW